MPTAAEVGETCLKEVLPSVEDHLPERILKQYDLVDKQTALQGIHFPKDSEDFFKARKRLVFEELFMLQLSLYQLKADFAKKLLGIAHGVTSELRAFMETLPFELTGAQKRVMREIVKDMKSPYAMNRLVQGDVG